MPRNHYHVIKDICDELIILQTLVKAQEDVWKQYFQTEDLDKFTGFQYTHLCAPTLVFQELQDMLVEAGRVQDAIHTLLDLRQKQASIKEAKFGRKQANDTAKQGNIIMVFTIVTIVFLPLSFLSSLFALNVSDFPHQGEDVVCQGWWIFPIIFGISACVSIPFILLALKVDKVVSLWDRIRSSKGTKAKGQQNTTPRLQSQRPDNMSKSVSGSGSYVDDYSFEQPKSRPALFQYAVRRHAMPQDPC
ncbi:hypothetical protein BDW69DRAFT_201455 [Aspergillus filifer]